MSCATSAEQSWREIVGWLAKFLKFAAQIGIASIFTFALPPASQATPLFQTGLTYHQHLTGATGLGEHTMDVTFTPGVYIDLGTFFRASIATCSFTFDTIHTIGCDTAASRTFALTSDCPTCFGDTDQISLVPSGIASPQNGINYFPDVLTCNNRLCFELIVENVHGSSRQFDVQALVNVNSVSEPAALLVFALGLMGISGMRIRRLGIGRLTPG